MIGDSELIINERGNIYHLDLHPGEIGDIIITVGDPERVKQVSRYFNSIEVKRAHREFVTHTGTFGNKRVSVISTGIGTDNIDIVLTELDALVNIDLNKREIKEKKSVLEIIRLGTSGALQKEIEVDSIMAGECAIGLDSLMLYYDIKNDNQHLLEVFEKEIFGTSPMKAYQFNADDALVKKFGSGLQKGITVTCSGFYGPQGRVLRAPLKFSSLIDKLTSFKYTQENKVQRISNFEMETSGIYGMSRLLGHRALSLNMIVANRVTNTFSKNANAGIEKLIEYFFSQL